MNKNILLIGAGRSTSMLLKYLSDHSTKEGWSIRVGDQDPRRVKSIIDNNEHIHVFQLDVKDKKQVIEEIKKADIVISMLPASMHVNIAKKCIEYKKQMVTASYISDEMKALEKDAQKAGVIIMNEIGVDPGIDHMSAMRVIDKIKKEGGKLIQFETFTGGLLAPESDKDNPWNYKFTWNPRNVVMAGSGGPAKFIQEGKYKYIPYQKLFRRTELIDIEGYGKFEGYANRDSLKYRKIYHLEDIKTIYRGTLRRPGYCRAWDMFIQLGMTDDSFIIEDSETITYREFLNLFLPYHPTDSIELKLMQYLGLHQDDIKRMEKLKWLNLFEEIPVGIKNATPAQILQHILSQKWEMNKEDKDMLVMWHKFIYTNKGGEEKEKQSSLVVIGTDSIYTSMAKTVGLPVAIATKMILKKKIVTPGVHIPTKHEIYQPILEELEKNGIRFKEKDMQKVSRI